MDKRPAPASPRGVKRGRHAKKLRPDTLPGFRFKGFPNFDARNFIRGYVAAFQDVYSWRDFAAAFNTSVRTLRTICALDIEMKSEKVPIEKLSAQANAGEDFLVMMSESKSHNCKTMTNALTEQGIAVNRTTVWKAMQRMGMTWKRRPTKPWCGTQGEERWRMKRLPFAEAHVNEDPNQYVFVDECMIRALDN